MRDRNSSLVAYASTSGSTEAVARCLANLLGPSACAFNLKTLDDPMVPLPNANFGLVIAGTPTYGRGDWHYCWARHLAKLLPAMRAADRVLLFGLGDARGHRNTFANGIGILHQQIGKAGIHVASGWTSAIDFHFSSSSSVIDEQFPGLVVDYGREHRVIFDKIRNWVVQTRCGPDLLSSAFPLNANQMK